MLTETTNLVTWLGSRYFDPLIDLHFARVVDVVIRIASALVLPLLRSLRESGGIGCRVLFGFYIK